MKKLSPAKRNQVILACVMVLLVLCGLWSFLIRYQMRVLTELDAQKAASENKKSRVMQIISSSKSIEEELGLIDEKLVEHEDRMATGDLYSSMVDMVRRFKQDHNLDIPQFNASSETPVDILPKFPYKQVALSISGAGTYFDIGRFIADFENAFPAARIHNLTLSVSSAQTPAEREKLAFRMDIVSLVKPVQVATAKPL